MKKNLLKNECGELSYFSVFIILAVNMLLSFLLCCLPPSKSTASISVMR